MYHYNWIQVKQLIYQHIYTYTSMRIYTISYINYACTSAWQHLIQPVNVTSGRETMLMLWHHELDQSNGRSVLLVVLEWLSGCEKEVGVIVKCQMIISKFPQALSNYSSKYRNNWSTILWCDALSLSRTVSCSTMYTMSMRLLCYFWHL